MAEEQAKWYVIHTYSGYEAMVKDSLEKLIENNNLQENIVEIQIPTEETLEEKANGKKKLVERKKFPCYVFLKMIYSNDIWYLVTNTQGGNGVRRSAGQTPSAYGRGDRPPRHREGRGQRRLRGRGHRPRRIRPAGIVHGRHYRTQRARAESEGERYDVRPGNRSGTRFRADQKDRDRARRGGGRISI